MRIISAENCGRSAPSHLGEALVEALHRRVLRGLLHRLLARELRRLGLLDQRVRPGGVAGEDVHELGVVDLAVTGGVANVPQRVDLLFG